MKLYHFPSFAITNASFVNAVEATANWLRVSTYEVKQDANDAVDGATVSQAWAGAFVKLVTRLELTLDELRALPAWSDRSIWTGSGSYVAALGVPQRLTTIFWHNLTAEAFNTKAKAGRGALRDLLDSRIDVSPFLLYVPLESSTFDDCHLLSILASPQTIPHLLNGNPDSMFADPGALAEEVMPHLVVQHDTSVSAGGTLGFTIKAVDRAGNQIPCDSTIYLDAIFGYVPKTRVKLVNGMAYASVQALGLQPGDTVRVKVGWRHFRGDTDVVASVS